MPSKPKPKCRQCAKLLTKPRAPRPKLFCNDTCRWRFHNKERTDAVKTLRAQRTAAKDVRHPQTHTGAIDIESLPAKVREKLRGIPN